jgi:hypothetical protein
MVRGMIDKRGAGNASRNSGLDRHYGMAAPNCSILVHSLLTLWCAIALYLASVTDLVAQEKQAADNDDYRRFGIYAKTAPRPQNATPLVTELPLDLRRGERIALIGNTLLERTQLFGHF